MRIRRALVLAAAAVLGTVGAGVVAAPAHAVNAVTLNATIALNNCSASLVRYPTSVDSDRAMMLTNGHCYEGGFINDGVVLQNRSSTRSGTLIDSAGNNVGTVRADQVIYATMTGTDVTLYRLNETYAAFETLRQMIRYSPCRVVAVAGIARPSIDVDNHCLAIFLDDCVATKNLQAESARSSKRYLPQIRDLEKMPEHSLVTMIKPLEPIGSP